MLSLVFLFLILLGCNKNNLINAFFEEQVGESDWRLENTGTELKHAVFGAKSMVLASNDVLASMNIITGNFEWRVNLNNDMDIEKMILSDDGSMIFTMSNNGNIIRSWSTKSGKLIWENRLNIRIGDDDFHDNALVASNRDIIEIIPGYLVVLTYNDIHILSSLNGSIQAEKLSLSNALTKRSGETYIISNLIIPKSASNASSIKKLNTAVGCTVKSYGSKNMQTEENFNSALCNKIISIEVNISSWKFNVKEHGKFSGSVPAKNVYGIMSTDALATSDAGDTIFGSVVTDTTYKLHSYKPSSSLTNVISVPTSYHGNSKMDYSDIHVLRSDDGEVASPTISACKTKNFDTKNSCTVYTFDITSNTVSEKISCKGVSTHVSFGRISSNSHVIDSVTCTNIENDYKGLKYVLYKVNDESSTSDVIQLDRTIQGIGHSFSRVPHSKNYKNRLMIMSSSGTVIMIQSDDIVWMKEELSNIKNTVFVEQQLELKQSCSLDSEQDSLIPVFKQRLELQMNELTNSVMNIISSFVALPASIAQITSPASLLNYFKRQADKKTREEKDLEAQQFGFNKIAIFLTSVDSKSNEASGFGTLQDAAIKIVAVELVHGDIVWTFEPLIASLKDKLPTQALYSVKGSEKVYYSVKLLKSKSTTCAQLTDIILLASIRVGSKTYNLKYTLDAYNGNIIHEDINEGKVFIDEILSTRDGSHFMLGTNVEKDEEPLVSTLSTPTSSNSITKKFFYKVDEERGILNSFQIDTKTCQNTTDWCKSFPVASMAFNPENERIIATSYAVQDDKIISNVVIMGDDSLLLKYINPNLIVIITQSDAKDDSGYSTIHVNIVDSISAKVIYRTSHEEAGGPVSSIVIENNIIVSYWNNKAKRTEISSISLYEGMIDKHSLGPYGFSNGKHSRHTEQAKEVFSSFSHDVPIAMQKTYVMPRKVLSLQNAVTSRGISNKDILVALDNGQIFVLDRRQIDPRRPINPPMPREKEEGLMQYLPYVFMNPTQCITFNSTLPTTRPIDMHTTPALLESTTMILTHGLDVHFVRMSSSRGFDLLAPDFNYGLLLLILVGMAVALYTVRNMAKTKSLNAGWK